MATTETLSSAARSELRGIAGEIIGPEDSGYDEARAVHNGMIDRSPGVILRAASADDVAAGIGFARSHDVPLAIRGGGHSAPGLGTIDDGVVIDLAPLSAVTVDAAGRTVAVGGGATLTQVDAATAEVGMATPLGILGTTGVGGLTLGGGIGHLARKHGLTIDNLLGADVVLADGSKVTASPDENPDLFWAIRGGGGNFGVVTEFRYRLHPVSTVIAGPDLLVARRHRRGHAALPGVHPAGAAGAERVLRVRDRAAGGAVPGGAPRPQGERRRLVLRRRRQRRGPGRHGPDARGARSRSCTVPARCRSPGSRGSSTSSTRRACRATGARTS